jgi:hypothetical protein
MDEPFGALDNQTRVLMQELLLGIWEAERKTVMFVTHDIDEAIFMANRVAVFSARPGRIKSDIAVDLPHPRHYTIKTSPEFMELKARLTEEIRAEAMAAERIETMRQHPPPLTSPPRTARRRRCRSRCTSRSRTIARKIQDAWKAGDRVPSEQELVPQFGVSRMTVNRALRELAEQGGSCAWRCGQFVAEEKPQSTLLRLPTWRRDPQRGHDYTLRGALVERVSAASRSPRRWICARASRCSTRVRALRGRRAGAARRPLREPAPGARLHRPGFRRAALGIPGAQCAVRPDGACGRCRLRHAEQARCWRWRRPSPACC